MTMLVPVGCESLILVAQPTGPRGPRGAAGLTGTTQLIAAPYAIQEGDGALWVDLTSGGIPLTLTSLGADAQIFVNDYLGLASPSSPITLVGTASGSVNPTLIDIAFNTAFLFYSVDLNLWSYKV